MKTRLTFAALLLMIGVVQVRAGENRPSLKISQRNGSGIFLVNYQGTQKANLNVTIKDYDGTVLFTESVKHVKGFLLPINLENVGEGVYTVEVDNMSIKEVGTLDYTNQTPNTYAHVTHVGENRYMLSVAHPGTEKIGIKILNASGESVYEKEELINGKFARVYKVSNFDGPPSFEVSDLSGHSIIIQ